MENYFYWITEYLQILLGYGFLMFLWPAVVFRNFLKTKSMTYRFGFCTLTQAVLIPTVVLTLGLFHLLNVWTVRLVFYGSFAFSLREYYILTKQRRQRFRALLSGTFGWKNLLLRAGQALILAIKTALRRFWSFYKPHWLEYTVLLVLLLYGMIFYSWQSVQTQYYGFSDMIVHHSWVYGLIKGKPFSAGIYPEGMHCIVYTIYALFDIEVYSIILLLGGIHIVLFLLAVYCLAKEVFHWRFTSLLLLTLFLFLRPSSSVVSSAMSRLQCTLPQEYGFFAIYLCALFLIRFLRKERDFSGKKKRLLRYLFDEDLMLFVLAFAATVIIHFYVTFMAFFLCLGIAIYYWRRILKQKRFVSLVFGVLVGLIVAVTPMVMGYASGIPLQGSLYWGLGIINGEKGASDDANADGTEEEQAGGMEGLGDLTVEALLALGKQKAEVLYEEGYMALFYPALAYLFFGTIGVVLFVTVGYHMVLFVNNRFRRRKKKEKIRKQLFLERYIPIFFATLILMIAYRPSEFGIPEFVQISRLGIILQVVNLMVILMPFDILFGIVTRIKRGMVLNFCSVAAMIATMITIHRQDYYHYYLAFDIARYTAAVNVTNDIIASLPQYSYTIISTTDELYQVIEHGRHEETLTFVKNQARNFYTIPTEYLFLFVEKRAMTYVQHNYADGPSFLAKRREPKLDSYGVWPKLQGIDTSEMYASEEVNSLYRDILQYNAVWNRVILQSKMMKWCERFDELYPNELVTYYEDEEFVCYYIQQNPKRLYNLILD